MASQWTVPTYTESIWAEGTLPGCQELILSANCPRQNGRIFVMYHGTTIDRALNIMRTGFKPSEDGMLGRGVYVSRDLRKAMRYPLGDKTYQAVLKLRVNVGKVVMISGQGDPMQKKWHEMYDTAWVPEKCGMVGSGLEEACVWDPRRIEVVGIKYMSPQAVYRWAEQMALKLLQNL